MTKKNPASVARRDHEEKRISLCSARLVFGGPFPFRESRTPAEGLATLYADRDGRASNPGLLTGLWSAGPGTGGPTKFET
jgi:hypothetical protein